MEARTTLILLITALALGCSDSTPAGLDSSQPLDGPGSPDAAKDTQPADTWQGDLAVDGMGDLLTDATVVDGKITNNCTAKTADGLALNPGCDPDFQAKGPTAIGQFSDATTGNAIWMFTCGKKFWLFNPQIAGSGAFTAGGKDIATTLKTFQPGCASKSADGTFHNPGCDLTFQANGPDALGEVKDVNTKKISWLLSSGKKFWIFDPSAAVGKGAFIASGADISLATLPLSPSCSVKAPDGTTLNPGCDITFKANGLTAWGEFLNSATNKAAWMFVSGKKYWIFDKAAQTGKGAFIAAGGDLAAMLTVLSPSCAAKAADGTPLNPGCDSDFKAMGPTAIGEMVNTTTGKATWLFTTQKKFWLYSVATNAFVAAGEDIAKTMRKLAP